MIVVVIAFVVVMAFLNNKLWEPVVTIFSSSGVKDDGKWLDEAQCLEYGHREHGADSSTSQTGTLVLSYFMGYTAGVRAKMIHGYFGSLRRAGHTGYQTLVHDGQFCEEAAAIYKTECFDYNILNLSSNLRSSSVAKRFLYWSRYLSDFAPKGIG